MDEEDEEEDEEGEKEEEKEKDYDDMILDENLQARRNAGQGVV